MDPSALRHSISAAAGRDRPFHAQRCRIVQSGGRPGAWSAALVACSSLLVGAAAQDGIDTLQHDLTAPEVAWRVAACCILVLGSAYCSGLTLAVMGLDPQTLEITKAAGTPEERVWAAAILPVRRKGNQLLASLLWSNMCVPHARVEMLVDALTRHFSRAGVRGGRPHCVGSLARTSPIASPPRGPPPLSHALHLRRAVNSLLSIIMADLTSGVVGFVVSTVVIVLFGEIVPQASCSRHALRVGSFFVPSVKVLLFVLYPVSTSWARRSARCTASASSRRCCRST